MPRLLRRRPKPNRRRALELLAPCRDACTEAIVVARVFAVAQLVRAKLATGTPERVVARDRTLEVARVRITEEGWRALAGEVR
jgi:hypothetical protein